jgi:hypothetical protein
MSTGAEMPVLSPDDVSSESVEQLVARGNAYLREYDLIGDRPTILLKNTAAVLVALRAKCLDGDGRPDYMGRSSEYRRLAGEVYRNIGVGGQLERTQQAVRWHIGNLLREVLTVDELQDYELVKDSPAIRQQVSREAKSALEAAGRSQIVDVRAGEPTITRAVADQVTLGKSIRNIVTSLDVEAISNLSDKKRAALDEQLAEAQRVIAHLRRHTRKRSSDG